MRDREKTERTAVKTTAKKTARPVKKKQEQAKKETAEHTKKAASRKTAGRVLDEAEFEEKKNLILQLFGEPFYKPMGIRELAALLEVPKEDKRALKDVLTALFFEGRISLNARGKYALSKETVLCGIFQGNWKGFGFVKVSGQDGDIFISPEYCGSAMDGDEVCVRIKTKASRGHRAEGIVTAVLKHANESLVGLYREKKRGGCLVPDNSRIPLEFYIPEGRNGGAVSGDKVVARILRYPDTFGDSFPQGEVTEILGKADAPGVDVRSIIKAYRLPEQFPEEVEDSLSSVPDSVRPEDAAGRLDLRGVQMVTIDGDDAKDLDDAVSLRYSKETGLYELGVHIADVSAYVEEGSPLDREAERRGTSVYLPGRVLPMLPPKLSNGICSLNQREDRLALSCIMQIDRSGRIVSHQLAETLIRVSRRMSYQNVDAIIRKKDKRKMEQYSEFVPMLLRMRELSKLLRKRRRERGGIDFHFPESKITLDQKGRVLKIEPRARNAAQLLIEDFMLAANETVAEACCLMQLPFLYRTHEAPDPERMRALSVLVENLGYFIKGGKTNSLHPKALQELLERAAGTDEEALIAGLALRSMRQARYTTECTGHFGLAARYYTHFTSPIRRYPDLQIHRIIKEMLRGSLTKERIRHYEALLPSVAEDVSRQERLADEAERDCEKLKKCEYMQRFTGAEFDGVISGVTAFGFYVELENTCEGFVHVSTLADDYYAFDERQLKLCGRRGKRCYQLGQPVHIIVIDADKEFRAIDFRLFQAGEW